jgi:LPPG:FO 2-phospho-L-lactate transferase
MRVTLLAGGTGGAKLAHGFAMLGEAVELSVVANVADDLELHGLHVSPDVDALLYTLAGLIDSERGWGVVDDTFTAHLMLARYGGPAWFSLGDADLATHVERTRRLRSGETLTDATAAMAAALGVRARVLPSTDDRWRTRILTDDGEIDFQEYFVHQRQEPVVRGVRFDGDDARPTAAVLEAIGTADLVVIGPSNPIVSIGPTLELSGVRDAIRSTDARRVAVSPIVGGHALKGPADRMLTSLGHAPSALGVARLYEGLVDRFVLDEIDRGLADEVGAIGLEPIVLPTIMGSDDDRRRLAEALLPST